MSRALEKGLDLLSLVAEGHDTLASLTEASGLPKSTVHRLARVLIAKELLRYEESKYGLGHRLLELGGRARRQLSYVAVARPRLQATSDATLETVHLGELSDTHVVYMEKIDGRRELQMRSYVGLRIPAQTTAMGKVLIAFRPEEEWEGYLEHLPEKTANSITDPRAFREELQRVRERGYGFDDEENEPGVRCVAAPIWDAAGQVIAAVSISGASVYITPERLQRLVPEALACARSISTELGGGDGPEREERRD